MSLIIAYSSANKKQFFLGESSVSKLRAAKISTKEGFEAPNAS